MNETTNTENVWWGYKHTSGTFQVKPYYEARDIMEAQESPFCKHVVGPFEASNRDDAMIKVQQLVSSLNTDPPSEVEKKLYYCMKGSGGGFYTKLFHTIISADVNNQSRLSYGFPEEVKVAKKYKNEIGYWEQLEVRMKNDSIQK